MNKKQKAAQLSYKYFTIIRIRRLSSFLTKVRGCKVVVTITF
jgi:hypothetical protein